MKTGFEFVGYVNHRIMPAGLDGFPTPYGFVFWLSDSDDMQAVIVGPVDGAIRLWKHVPPDFDPKASGRPPDLRYPSLQALADVIVRAGGEVP